MGTSKMHRDLRTGLRRWLRVESLEIRQVMDAEMPMLFTASGTDVAEALPVTIQSTTAAELTWLTMAPQEIDLVEGGTAELPMDAVEHLGTPVSIYPGVYDTGIVQSGDSLSVVRGAEILLLNQSELPLGVQARIPVHHYPITQIHHGNRLSLVKNNWISETKSTVEIESYDISNLTDPKLIDSKEYAGWASPIKSSSDQATIVISDGHQHQLVSLGDEITPIAVFNTQALAGTSGLDSVSGLVEVDEGIIVWGHVWDPEKGSVSTKFELFTNHENSHQYQSVDVLEFDGVPIYSHDGLHAIANKLPVIMVASDGNVATSLVTIDITNSDLKVASEIALVDKNSDQWVMAHDLGASQPWIATSRELLTIDLSTSSTQVTGRTRLDGPVSSWLTLDEGLVAAIVDTTDRANLPEVELLPSSFEIVVLDTRGGVNVELASTTAITSGKYDWIDFESSYLPESQLLVISGTKLHKGVEPSVRTTVIASEKSIAAESDLLSAVVSVAGDFVGEPMWAESLVAVYRLNETSTFDELAVFTLDSTMRSARSHGNQLLLFTDQQILAIAQDTLAIESVVELGPFQEAFITCGTTNVSTLDPLVKFDELVLESPNASSTSSTTVIELLEGIVDPEIKFVEFALDDSAKWNVEQLLGMSAKSIMQPLAKNFVEAPTEELLYASTSVDDQSEYFTVTSDGQEWDFMMFAGQATPVLAELNLFHNTGLPTDTNGDGATTPLDVLLVVNELNSRGSRVLPNRVETESFASWKIDVSGDQRLNPLDVLLIVNVINDADESTPFAGTQLSTDARMAEPNVDFGDDTNEFADTRPDGANVPADDLWGTRLAIWDQEAYKNSDESLHDSQETSSPKLGLAQELSDLAITELMADVEIK